MSKYPDLRGLKRFTVKVYWKSWSWYYGILAAGPVHCFGLGPLRIQYYGREWSRNHRGAK
jgi:hypothetical protein